MTHAASLLQEFKRCWRMNSNCNRKNQGIHFLLGVLTNTCNKSLWSKPRRVGFVTLLTVIQVEHRSKLPCYHSHCSRPLGQMVFLILRTSCWVEEVKDNLSGFCEQRSSRSVHCDPKTAKRTGWYEWLTQTKMLDGPGWSLLSTSHRRIFDRRFESKTKRKQEIYFTLIKINKWIPSAKQFVPVPQTC